MKWIISNHKDQLVEDSYQIELRKLEHPNITLIVCPNDKQLSTFKEDGYLLGSQDVGYAYDIKELKEKAVRYTIIGHSDKRKKYHESNREMNQKMKELLNSGICPILCIGETDEEEDVIEEILAKELQESLKDIHTDTLMIAYEPVWAIGSGKIPSQARLIEILKYIRDKTKELIGIEPILIYGGSVNSTTVHSLENIKLLNGYLIGSASLNIEELKKIIEVIK